MLPWLCSELLFFCNLLCKPSSNPNTSFFFPFWHQKYQFLPHSHAAEMQALDLTPSAILVPVSPVPSANTGGFRRAQMRFSLPGGLQHSQSMSKKISWGMGKDGDTLQFPHPSPSCAGFGCSVPKAPRAGRELADRTQADGKPWGRPQIPSQSKERDPGACSFPSALPLGYKGCFPPSSGGKTQPAAPVTFTTKCLIPTGTLGKGFPCAHRWGSKVGKGLCSGTELTPLFVQFCC